MNQNTGIARCRNATATTSAFHSAMSFVSSTSKYRWSLAAFATPTHNRHKPSCLERIKRQRRFKETQKPFLFRLLPGNNDRQARRNLIDPKRLRNTDRYQDQQQIPGSRFFQTNRFEYILKTCYHSFWIYPFRVSLFHKIPPYMFCEVGSQMVAVRRYFIINLLSFSHF